MFFFQPRTLQKFAQESQSGATNSVTSNGDKGGIGRQHGMLFVQTHLQICFANVKQLWKELWTPSLVEFFTTILV